MEEAEQADLLALARQLRVAATAAGRPDVAAKAEEAIVLIARTERDEDKRTAILRILDGLGF